MAYTHRTASPTSDASLAPLLDAAFGRANRESKLVTQLAGGYPAFDPGMSLVASAEGRDLGYGLFLPRGFRIRGCDVPMAISAPFGIVADARGLGVGSFLLETGLGALKDRGLRGAVAMGGQGFFRRHGFESAFNLYTCDAQRDLLPKQEAGDWGGLSGEDIPHLMQLFASNYRGVSGSEQRSNAALDWESNAAAAYTLVHRRDDTAVAYVRFRVRDTLAVMECGAKDADAVTSLLAFMRRLAEEHNRPNIEVHVPPPHPVFRALFRLGCMAEGNNFHDEVMLRIVDWKGLLEDTAASWLRPMELCEQDELSLGIDGASYRLKRTASGLEVSEAKSERHIELPTGWAVPLLTGRLDWRDLYFETGGEIGGQSMDSSGHDLIGMLFPPGTPMWTYSPVFEIADE
jgi:predicted N-acetyltransferase YhbS